MDKNFLIEKTVDIIRDADEQNLKYDYDDGYIVEFIENGKLYNIKFSRRIFGLFSYIRLSETYHNLVGFRINRKDFKILKKSYFDREEVFRKERLNRLFPDKKRDDVLNEILK